jgi:DNA-binding transcriptional regulator YiaG
MTSKELLAWRKSHALTQDVLATMLGVTNPCISQWESGKRKIPAFLHLALKCLKVKKGGVSKLREKKNRKVVRK